MNRNVYANWSLSCLFFLEETSSFPPFHCDRFSPVDEIDSHILSEFSALFLGYLRSYDISLHPIFLYSYIGPKTWNNLPAQIELSKNVNTFKHDIKKSFFDDLQKQNDDIFFYY